MKDLLLRMIALFTLAAAAPVLLAADQEDAADQNTEADLPGIVEQWSDAAFNNYINLDLLSRALATGDASLLTDGALQFLKAEDILLRSHQAVAAEDLVLRAARLAGDQRDLESVDRLAKATESLKNEKLNAAIDAARKQAKASLSASPAVSVKATSVEEFAIYKQLVDEVRAAAVVGDQERLKQTRKAVEESVLSEERKESLLKSIDESRPEEAMNDALSKLASVSRDGYEGRGEDFSTRGDYGGGGESFGGGEESSGGDLGGFLGGLLGGGGESFSGGGKSFGGGGESFGGGNLNNFVPSQPTYQPPSTGYRPQPASTVKSTNPFARRQPTPAPSSPAPKPQPTSTAKSTNPFARRQPTPAPSSPAPKPQPTSTAKSTNPFARRQPTPAPSSPAPTPQPASTAKSTNPFARRQPTPATSKPVPTPQPTSTGKSTNPFARNSSPKPKSQDPPCGDPSKPLGIAWKKEADARRCVESGQAHMVEGLVNVQVVNPTKETFFVFSINQNAKDLALAMVGSLQPKGNTMLTFPKGTEIVLLPDGALANPQSATRFKANLPNSVVVLK